MLKVEHKTWIGTDGVLTLNLSLSLITLRLRNQRWLIIYKMMKNRNYIHYFIQCNQMSKELIFGFAEIIID
jgi:hypothetical protein